MFPTLDVNPRPWAQEWYQAAVSLPSADGQSDTCSSLACQQKNTLFPSVCKQRWRVCAFPSGSHGFCCAWVGSEGEYCNPKTFQRLWADHHKCCFRRVASLPRRRRHAAHSVIPMTVKFGGCSSG